METEASATSSDEQAASSVVILESEADLVAFLATLPPPGPLRRCSVDTEADSLHSYKEKLCLIQFSCAEQHVIIDPLRIKDLTPFIDFLRTAEVWMHGADFDMSLFRRTFDFVPGVVYDTQVAARLCGYRQFGLAHLVHEIFGVSLSKSSQRANWGKRPLTPLMAEYAVNDVRYVLPLADHLLARLEPLGRTDWFRQSCAGAREAVVNRPPPDQQEAWRVSGWGNLQQKGLAALQALWHWRNGEAERMDRPPFKIINNEALVAFAEQFQKGEMPPLPVRFPPPPRRRFYQALEAVNKLPAEKWPLRRIRPLAPKPAEAEPRFDHLKRFRDKEGTQLDIEGALIASRSVLEDIAVDAKAASALLPWQLTIMQPALEQLDSIKAPPNPQMHRRKQKKAKDKAAQLDQSPPPPEEAAD